MGEFSNWGLKEEFDPTWPYLFKWGYDSRSDKAHAWRIGDKEGDGSLTHRDEFERYFGRPAHVQTGDELGVATYLPAEHKLDGSVVAPPEIQMHGYYGKDPHDRVYEWFLQKFPDVVVRKAAVFPKAARVASPPVRWTWSEDTGPVFGVKEFGPKSFTGHAEVRPDHVQIVADRPEMPPQGLAAIKAELAKTYKQEILLPISPEESFAGTPTLLDQSRTERENRQVAASIWADENLHREDELVPESDSLDEPLTYGQRERGRNILRDLFGRKTAADGADMEGAMIAVFIPENVAKKIKVRGGEEVENMHITLAYFTDKAADRDDWDEVRKIVETIANQTAPMSGKVGGVGVFQNDDGDVLWASPSIPGLAELRHKVVEACEDAGFNVSDEHGWVPHITLKYKHRGKLPKLDSDLELDITELSFAQGEKHDDFKLDGEFVKETSWEMQEWKWPGTMRFVTDGKEILTEPEDSSEWHGNSLDGLHEKFRSFYPDSNVKPQSGWVIPTQDEQGYGIWAPKVGYGDNEELGLHDLVAKLDKELKKPTHLVEEWNQITDPDLYRSTHPD